MTYYTIAYIAFLCPGGWLSSIIETKLPSALKPLVCGERVEIERLPNRVEALARFREVGGQGRIQWCKNLRCVDKKVTRITTIVIE